MSSISAIWRRPSVVRRGWAAIAVILLGVVSSTLLEACGSSSGSVTFTGSAFPNVDPSNTRHSEGSIDNSVVSELGVAWTLSLKARAQGSYPSGPVVPVDAYGSYSSSPVVSKDVIYSQDLESNVQAIDLESGEVLWTKRFGLPSRGPNGVVVAGGRVYGATPTSAFALDQETGDEIWSIPLVRSKNEGINMAPGYDSGKVYVSTMPGTLNEPNPRGGGVGVLWALDAGTGKKLWHFDTVPENLWGNTRVNSGGGLWSTPAFDGKGFMYVAVAGPDPLPGTAGSPWGSSRPGPNLYTNSIAKLDAKTGKMEWFYQLTPHDLYDWDLQAPVILMNVGSQDLVVAAGKSGIAIALDAKTGKLAWEQPLGRHNGHDDDGLYAMRGEYSKLKLIPTLYPGTLGGVIAPMSTDGSSVFVPVVNHPVRVPGSGMEIREYSRVHLGEVVALNAKTGAVEWEHEFPVSPMLGATTAVNDLVFTTTATGKIYALNAKSGQIAWQDELPLGTKTGVTVSGDTVIAPAGLFSDIRQTTEIVAYRLDG